MNKTKRIAFGIGMVLAVLVVFTASAAADNEVYFVPDPSCAGPSETTVVTLRMNITDGVASFGCDVYFDLDVVNITSGAPGDLPTMWLFSHRGNWVRFGGWSPTYLDLPPGDYKLADLTLVANNTGTSALHFDPVWSLLSDQQGKTVPATWNDGTFNCPCPTPETFTKELVAGWNLISLPLTNATDMTVANIIDASLSGSYDALYKYNASTHSFVSMSSTDTMENGAGYFINMTSGDTWAYTGSAYTSMNVELKEGLNMIGWLNSSKLISGNLTEGKYWYVASWNATATLPSFGTFNPIAPDGFNDFTRMERGTGYFISAKESCWLNVSC